LRLGNDSANTDAQVKAAATYVAQQIVQRFPTAKTIFTGVIGDCAATSSGVIGASDLSRNAAIAAGAALLPRVGGKTPFVDTYANGLAAERLFTDWVPWPIPSEYQFELEEHYHPESSDRPRFAIYFQLVGHPNQGSPV